MTSLNSVAIKNRPDRPTVNTKLTRELQHVASGLVLGDQVGLLRIREAPLRLEGSGWLSRLLIRE